MKNMLQHKGFLGSVQYSDRDSIFYGKIEGIDDLVTFEGKSVDEIKKAFQEAVNDYLDFCKDIGKKAFKSYKGSFNVRLGQELHAISSLVARTSGISLNQFVKEAIEREIENRIKNESINVPIDTFLSKQLKDRIQK
jgi:predicted HicB family RNase H-like nuclease